MVTRSSHWSHHHHHTGVTLVTLVSRWSHHHHHPTQVLNLDDVEKILGHRPFTSAELRNIDRFRCV